MAMGNEEATIIVFMTEGSLPTAKACRKNTSIGKALPFDASRQMLRPIHLIPQPSISIHLFFSSSSSASIHYDRYSTAFEMHPYLHSAFLYLLARLRDEALHRIAGFTRAGIAFLRDASGHELENSGLEDQVTLRFAIYLPVFLIALLAIALVDTLLSVTRREIERVM
ncbi:hypothetical protein CMEL01_12394 [Colletotrichum melonis]|uniref:Uncharacterized protein n=1 Tax=Colletotrichum melonis TaxID=1209925 RepID=A0AAI9UUN4_9PEZI|nr:hypothetical protein CMEL01_12394 [Colletotrichum melonis]